MSAALVRQMEARARPVLLIMVLVLLFGGQAHAGSAPADAGVSTGIALYGKVGDCDHHAGTWPSGGGLGLTGWSAPKDLWMRYEGQAVSAVLGQFGTLTFCARLTNVLGNVMPLGAGCDFSKAYAGFGSLVWPAGDPVYLSRLGWKLGASPGQVPGQYAVMTGQARGDHGGAHAKGKDKLAADDPSAFIALVTMGTGAACLKPTAKGPSDGWTWGNVVMEYAIVPGVDLTGFGQPPPLCKQSGPPLNPPATDTPFVIDPGSGCLYGDKP